MRPRRPGVHTRAGVTIISKIIMIYIVFAPPRQGKTYYCTYLALSELRKTKRAKKVFSNFPIMYQEKLTIRQRIDNCFLKLHNYFSKKKLPLEKGKLLSTYKWLPEYVYTGVHDALIIIDEAYRDYNSHDHRDFDKDQHTFFATNGHDKNDIYLIAQGINRINLVIREMVNLYIFVKKVHFVFVNHPLWFTIESYQSEEDFRRRKKDEECTWDRKRMFWKSDVAQAYDTHYFRHEIDDTPYQLWSDLIEMDNCITVSEDTKNEKKPEISVEYRRDPAEQINTIVQYRKKA